MIVHFYDSSSFVKLFVNEKGTEAMVRLHRSAQRRIVSRLVTVEAYSAIARLAREQHLTELEAEDARTQLAQEIARSEVIELNVEVASLAQDLLLRHTLRSPDAIQLASALVVTLVNSLVFVSSDVSLIAAASAEGLLVIDPMASHTALSETSQR